ncbi:MAG: protoporphyrinogen oxidase HemJ [Candidatus Sericytochromatia bacterium]
MAALYPWIKAFHIMAVVAWFAGLFYIFRLYVYHIEATEQAVKDTLAVMETKLLRIIMNPSMLVAWALGICLIVLLPGAMKQGWLHVKLLLVLLLSGYHGYAAVVRKQLAAGTCTLTSKQARLINEVPAVLLIGIVLLVELQPWK